jgi:penicillin-binding protein 1A
VQRIPVVDPTVAWTMNQALQGVVKYGTASDAVWGAGFHVPAGGKTGTTNDFRDAWYIGFTPDVVAGIWVGFDHPQSIKQGAVGGYIVAPAWTRMMMDIYSRRPEPVDWTPPSQAASVPSVGTASGGP